MPISSSRLRSAGNSPSSFRRQSSIIPNHVIPTITSTSNSSSHLLDDAKSLQNTSFSNISVATTVMSQYPSSRGGGLMSSGGGGYADNIRVCARIRPLNSIESDLNAQLSKKGIKDSTFECCRYPPNSNEVIELRVPDSLLLAAPVEGSGSSGGRQGGGGTTHHNEDSSLDHNHLTRLLAGGGSGGGGSGAISPTTSSKALNSVPVSSHQFTFSRVFTQTSTQQEVYDEVGAPVIKDVVNGYNGTIFVYGQTGSGKTHSMMGAPAVTAPHSHNTSPAISRLPSPSSSRSNNKFSSSGNPNSHHYSNQPHHSSSHNLNAAPVYDLDISSEAGIVPRAIEGLFECMYAAPSTTSFALTMYFVEIYMEKVRDLLVADPSTSNLAVREDPKAGSFFVDGCLTPEVSKPADIMALLNFGLHNRATAATKMNHSSSRSHCLLCVQVKVMDGLEGQSRHGKLFMVDLAGSEKVAKTKAEGQQLEEAKLINKSLTTLGHVINNLTDRNAAHIPYRDSKLTRILQEALGGNSRTTLVVCCSPSVRNIQETLSTLRFGQRAKNIKNRAVVNKDLTVEDLVLQLDAAKREIEELRGHTHRTANSSLSCSDAEDWLTGTNGPITRKLQLDENEYEINALRSEKMELVSSVQRLEDELREVSEGSRGASVASNIVAALRREIRVWEQEFTSQHVSLAASTSENAFLRESRVAQVAAISRIHRQNVDLRKTIDGLKKRCEVAMKLVRDDTERREIQEEELRGVIVTLRHERTPRSPPPLQRQQQQAVKVEVPAVDEVAVQKHQADLMALRAAYAKMEVVEEQKEESERALREALDTQSALVIDIQLLQKKLEIRTERIEMLKRGVAESHEAYHQLENDSEEKQQKLRSSMLDARSDAAHWRERYTTIKQEFEDLQKEKKLLSDSVGRRGVSVDVEALLQSTMSRSTVVRGTTAASTLVTGNNGPSSSPSPLPHHQDPSEEY